jgi:hypothetical protein
MQKTPSPESDGLPFHPKYLRAPGYETMSHEEFRAWLHSDPCAPPLYGSQPTSAGNTRPISPSSSDSALLRCQISTEGQYSPITRQATLEVTQPGTPEVAPEIGLPLASRGCSPCSPFGGVSYHSHPLSLKFRSPAQSPP